MAFDGLLNQILLFDGGMGTMLQSRGLASGERTEEWNLTHAQDVLSIHAQYLRAGAHCISTNTFGANPIVHGKEHSAQLVRIGVDIARYAVAECGHGLVALDIGPTGRLLAPLGDLKFEDAVCAYAQMAQAGADADLILLETFSDPYELKAAILGIRSVCALPIAATIVVDALGRTLTGATIECIVATLEAFGVCAVGMNCGLGGDQMLPLVPRFAACTHVPLLIQPNAGLPTLCDGQAHFSVNPSTFAHQLYSLAQGGAAFLGGCCGTTPAHIAAAHARLNHFVPAPRAKSNCILITSTTKVVTLTPHTRICSLLRPDVLQAMRNDDFEPLLDFALDQEEHGAQILSLSCPLDPEWQLRLLPEAVAQVQQVTALPLRLDCADPIALESALRKYNGAPLVLCPDALAPLVARYAGHCT